MNKKTLIILLAVALLFAGGAGLYFLSADVEPQNNPQVPQGASMPEVLGSSSLPPVRKAPEGFAEYRNAQYRFSLLHPSFLEVVEYDEKDGARTISFESLEESRGFQIFIVPYSESQVSEAQFRQDVPSGVRTDTKEISVAGAKGAAFYSKDPFLGDTREVWFIRDGYLYEVTTFKELDTWLADVIETWQFI